MNTFNIPMTMNRYNDGLETDHVIAFKSTGKRFGLGSTPEGKSARQVSQGPMVPGPWAYAFGLCVAITADPSTGTAAETRRLENENKFHLVEDGDILEIDGQSYKVRVVRREYIELDPQF